MLALPEMGSVFQQSLISQDMPLAGGILLIYYVLVVIGTLISDRLLFWLDPRIRLATGPGAARVSPAASLPREPFATTGWLG